MYKTFLFLLIFSNILFAQLFPRSVQWWHLADGAKDSLLARGVADDTTELKTMTFPVNGSMVYLRGYVAGDSTGNGLFYQEDSSFAEDGESVFNNATSGLQWVRADFWTKKVVSDSIATWSDTTAMKADDAVKGYLEQSGLQGWFVQVDSAYQEGSTNVFACTTAAKQYVRYELLAMRQFGIAGNIDEGILKTMLQSVSVTDVADINLYGASLSTAKNIGMESINALVFDGRGQTWDFGDSTLLVWGQDVSSPLNVSTSLGDYDFTIPSAISSAINKDSYYIIVGDTADFEPIAEWDLMTLRDNSGAGPANDPRGMTNFFDRWGINAGGDDTLYFKYPIANFVDKSNLDTRIKVRLQDMIIFKDIVFKNCEIEVRGNKFVIFENCMFLRDIPDYNTQGPQGSVINWAVSVSYGAWTAFNNCVFSGFIGDGIGYGIGLGREFDVAMINNCKFHNLRHAIDTGTDRGGSGFVLVTNSEFATGDPWQTHQSFLDSHFDNKVMWIVTNCIFRNYQTMLSMDNPRAYVSNVYLYDVQRGIGIEDPGSAINDSSGQFVYIDGYYVENPTQNHIIIAGANEGIKFKNIVVRNFNVNSIGGKGFGAGQSLYDSVVDTLIFEHGSFIGGDTAKDGDVFISAFMDSIEYLKIHNVEAERFQFGVEIPQWSRIKNWDLRNNKFGKMQAFIDVDSNSDTTNVDVESFISRNNHYSTMSSWIDVHSITFRIKRFSSIKDEFELIEDVWDGFFEYKIDNLEFIRPTFRNCYGGNILNLVRLSGTNFYLIGSFTPRLVDADATAVINAYSSYTYPWAGTSIASAQRLLAHTFDSGKHNSIKNDFVISNNEFYGQGDVDEGSVLFIDRGTAKNIKIVDNIFHPDSVGQHGVIFLDHSAKAEIIDNKIWCQPQAGLSAAWYGGIWTDGGSYVLLDQNFIKDLSGGQGTSNGIYVSDATDSVSLGRNSGQGWDTFYQKNASAGVDTLQFTN